MKTIPLILAGGKGERFWPMSRSSRPKQLLPLVSTRTMIEETLLRAKQVAPGSTSLIISGKDCATGIRKAIGNRIPFDNIVEPVGKNTAPAIALAAAWMEKKYGEAVMLVMSADHNITPIAAFAASVKNAVSLASTTDSLVVFGIRPSRPDVGYGYINIGKAIGSSKNASSWQVKRFVEKPSLAVAKKYVASGKYLWNSGMFVWKTSVFLAEVKKHMPDLFAQVQAAAKAGFSKKAIDTFYNSCVKESVDYGIMEKSSRIAAVSGAFSWDDIGSWESMARIHTPSAAGNVVIGETVLASECKNVIINNSSKLAVASIGLADTVIVVTPDAVLAIARSELPNLKTYLAQMKDKKFSPDLF